jgi:hypothetical protein
MFLLLDPVDRRLERLLLLTGLHLLFRLLHLGRQLLAIPQSLNLRHPVLLASAEGKPCSASNQRGGSYGGNSQSL